MSSLLSSTLVPDNTAQPSFHTLSTLPITLTFSRSEREEAAFAVKGLPSDPLTGKPFPRGPTIPQPFKLATEALHQPGGGFGDGGKDVRYGDTDSGASVGGRSAAGYAPAPLPSGRSAGPAPRRASIRRASAPAVPPLFSAGSVTRGGASTFVDRRAAPVAAF